MVFPWLLWILRKNQNALIFEGGVFVVGEMVDRFFLDFREWLQAQVIDSQVDQLSLYPSDSDRNRWVPPETSWPKCDIGVTWNNSSLVNSVSWILRNEAGEVLLHSRNSFVNVKSKLEVYGNGWLWAIENMASLRYTKIVFRVEALICWGRCLDHLHGHSLSGFQVKFCALFKLLGCENWN